MKKLLCFGDSNTYGYRPYDGRYAVDIRWTGRLAQSLGTTWQVIEAGQWQLRLAEDNCHFAPAGHAVFAQEIAKVIRNLDGSD